MRLLVACPQCKRQFDAGGRPIGSRFRCPCGAVVTIRQPHGHDAAVVRCSSCGAPREDGGAACRYCHSDFTIHEQDLDTVCPSCFARVSDSAKFCHHCGLALCPEPCVSEKTPLVCPACGKASRLSHRLIGDVAALECQRCAGLWLGVSVFDNLVERTTNDSLGVDWCLQAASRRSPAVDPSEQQGPLYRKCPYCTKLMGRRNYARHSGVIIDLCKDHGAWFDADELPRIIAWVRGGGLTDAKRKATEESKHQERLESIARVGRQRDAFAGLRWKPTILPMPSANWRR